MYLRTPTDPGRRVPRALRPRRSPRRVLATALLALAVAAGLSACDPPVGISIDGTAGLYPPFERSISDYVNRCDPGQSSALKIDAPEGTTVSVDGSTPQAGAFQVPVTQQVGQKVTIKLFTEDRVSSHFLRCLPTDFPQWRTERNGDTQAAFYVTNVMSDPFGSGYPTIFDNNGVPVWWTAKTRSLLLNPLPDGTLGQINTTINQFSATRLDGTIARSTELPAGYQIDNHEIQLLANGNYLVVGNDDKPCDLTSWGLAGPRKCLDHTLLEVTSTGQVAWSWDAAAHIAPPETPAVWQQYAIANPTFTGSTDNLHINSIDVVPGGYVISFRHLDAIVMVDRATGNISWKIGGTPTPGSLTIVGDPFAGPSGQHDARLAGNVLSLFDNGTLGNGPGRQDRSISYALDLGARTATLTRDTRDAISSTAFCCGSSRVLPGGNVVTGWGGSSHITENKPDGQRVFELDANSFVYRALPILPGELTIEQLRAGMDAQSTRGRL